MNRSRSHKKIVVTWIICCLLSVQAKASPLSRFTCFVNQLKNKPSKPQAETIDVPSNAAVIALTQRMENANSNIAKLTRNKDYVKTIGPSVQEDEMGESNNGVHRVETADGPAVLKYEMGSIANLKHTIMIQETLAELGLAPKIRAIIPAPEMKSLFKQNKVSAYKTISEKYLGDSFGVVMDEINGAWNFLKSDRIPPEITHWDESSIIAQVRKIESTFNQLQIVPRDLQLVISKDGQVKVIDVNEFAFVGSDKKIYNHPLDDRPVHLQKVDLSRVISKLEGLFRKGRSTDTSIHLEKNPYDHEISSVTGPNHSAVSLKELTPQTVYVSSVTYPSNSSGEIAPLLKSYFSANPNVQTIRYEFNYHGPDRAAYDQARKEGKTVLEAYASTPFFKACKSLGFGRIDAEWGKDADTEPYIQVHRGVEETSPPRPPREGRGYVGDKHPEYYDPETGVFTYHGTGDGGLALDNGDTPLRFLRLNFGNTSHVDRIFPLALADTVELMNREPNLKLRIALRAEDRAHLEPFLKNIPPKIRGRIDLFEVPGISLLRSWARDPSLLLADGKTMLISRDRSMGAISEELTGDMSLAHIEDYYKSVLAYAHESGLKVRTSAFRFEGGNIVVGRRNAFVGALIIREAMDDYHLTQAEAVTALSKEFGKPVLMVGEIQGFFSSQPKAHVDLAMGVVRSPRTDQETVLVESYQLAKDLLSRQPPVHPNAMESLIEQSYNGDPFSSDSEQKDLDALAVHLQKEGYHVVRVPGIPSSYKLPDLPMINYTNVLVTGRNALVPHFGVKALDIEVFKIFQQLGYEPIPATAATESFKDNGGPRCLTEACRE